MRKLIELIRENFVFIAVMITILFVGNYNLPYYIDGPGGLINLEERYKIDAEYKSKGSFNMTYVSEYKATIASYLYAKVNKDLDIYKASDILPENTNDKEEEIRGKIMLKESFDNAMIVAYKNAKKSYKIEKQNVQVTYIYKKAKTNLKVGDVINSIDSKIVNTKEEIEDILNAKSINDKIIIEVTNNNKKYTRYAYVDKKHKINMLISYKRKLLLDPSIKTSYKNNEYGSSGGLMTTLSIYNKLVKEDITKGLVVAGTGTIDEEGNVGEIDGIKYKLKGAVKNKADIFLAPSGDNYKEAIKLKKKNNYNIKIIEVKTFEDAIKKLKEV